MKKQVGKNTIGQGEKMTVEMKTYSRSTHDLSRIWRSSMSAGTLVPCLSLVCQNGDTHDIDITADVQTNATLGNLYGRFKLQIDLFEAAWRLYNAQLHNNELNIGLNVQNVLFPQLELASSNVAPSDESYQINPSCIYHYLGMKGLGTRLPGNTLPYVTRRFNAMPLLMYYDIFKNYYANKQETNAYVIHAAPIVLNAPTTIKINGITITGTPPVGGPVSTMYDLTFTYNAGVNIDLALAAQMIFLTTSGNLYTAPQMYANYVITGNGGATPTITFNGAIITTGILTAQLTTPADLQQLPPELTAFPLTNIDDMREAILQHPKTTPLIIDQNSPAPYGLPATNANNFSSMTQSQEGLVVKTYQSDLLNNWMNTTTIGNINATTAINTGSGSFTIDNLNLNKRVYDYLNRVAVSGGSYQDWLEVTYTSETFFQAMTPVYVGGMSMEILFQEVVATASSQTPQGQQPLGQQAAKGIVHKKRGGTITVRTKEPSNIIAIASITPYIDYSQGNDWPVDLKTLNDLHKPALDEIGWQDLVTDRMAYWDTYVNTTGVAFMNSAGKQPAWVNYMTAINELHGNFAIPNNQMFMVLSRRYEQDPTTGRIKDLTTYIDPTKSNYIFAVTSLDAQNFRVQIAINITSRRRMSAKVMPNP